MSAEGKKKDKGFIALLVLIIVCACLMIAAVTTLGIGMSNGVTDPDQPGQDVPVTGGTAWSSGTGAPAADAGNEGDFYLDTSSGNIYQKSASGWSVVMTIPLASEVTPSIGEDGYWYIGSKRTDVKAAGTDGLVPSIGADGYWYIGDKKTDKRAWHEFKIENNHWIVDGEDLGAALVTPHIGNPDNGEEEGYWYIGDTFTGVKAEGSKIEIRDGGLYVDGVRVPLDTLKGADGNTPYIGKNGNWWIGEKDLQVPAEGKDGQNGVTPHIDEETGHWFIGDEDTKIPATGADGKNGTYWHSGEGTPVAEEATEPDTFYVANASEGDFYFDTVTGDVYRLENGAWTLLTSLTFKLTGNQWTINGKSTGLYVAQWYNGNGDPNGKFPGYNGDFYLDVVSGIIYKNVSTKLDGELKGAEWKQELTIRSNQWFSGKGSPLVNLNGTYIAVGDMYLDIESGQVWQYTAEGWTEIEGLILKGENGTRGTRLFSGNVAPDDNENLDPNEIESGDLYFDTSKGIIYTATKDYTDGSVKWDPMNADDPLAGTKWLSGEKDPADYTAADTLYNALQEALENDVYFNTTTKTLWQKVGGNWQYLGSLAEQRANKWYHGSYDPEDLKGEDETLFKALTSDAIEGDFYLQTFSAFSGYTGMRIYVYQNGRWALLADSRIAVDQSTIESYNIPTLDVLREFRGSVNGGTDFTDKTVYLSGIITMPEEDFAGVGTTGTDAKPFNGTFDGQKDKGYYIENLGDYLFGNIGAGATVQNLDLRGKLDDAVLATFFAEGETPNFGSLLTGNYGLAESIDPSAQIKNVTLELTNDEATVTVEWDDKGEVTVTVKSNEDHKLVIGGAGWSYNSLLELGNANFEFVDVDFAGKTYLDVTNAKFLKLSGVTANVAPIEAAERDTDGTIKEWVDGGYSGQVAKNRSVHAAFIVSQNTTEATDPISVRIENSKINAAQSTENSDCALNTGLQVPDVNSMAIYISTQVAQVVISGSTFGTQDATGRYSSAVIELTNIAANATLNFDHNIVYGTNNHGQEGRGAGVEEFKAFVLGKSSDAYSAFFVGNTVDVSTQQDGAETYFLSVEGKGNAQVYFVGADNKFNGNNTLYKLVKAEAENIDFIAFSATLNQFIDPEEEITDPKLTIGLAYLGKDLSKNDDAFDILSALTENAATNHSVWIIDIHYDDPVGFVKHIASKDTYYINNAAGFGYFRDSVNGTKKDEAIVDSYDYAGKTVNLVKYNNESFMYDLSAWTTSIGSYADETSFKGTFNGNGNTLNKLGVELFGNLGEGAKVQNLYINEANISGEKFVGTVASVATGNVTISNVIVTASNLTLNVPALAEGQDKLTDEQLKYARSIGGIVGAADGTVTLSGVSFGQVESAVAAASVNPSNLNSTITNNYTEGGLNYLVYNYGLVGSKFSGTEYAGDAWATGKTILPAAEVNVTVGSDEFGEQTFTASFNAYIAATRLALTASYGLSGSKGDNVLVTAYDEVGLANIAEIVAHGVTFNGVYVLVGADINVALLKDDTTQMSAWKGIGTNTYAFEGTFMGAPDVEEGEDALTPHYINGLTGALFNNLKGTVKNLVLTEQCLNGSASIAAKADGAAINNVIINAWVQTVDGASDPSVSDLAAAPFGIYGGAVSSATVTNSTITVEFKAQNITFSAEIDKDQNAEVLFKGDTLAATETAATHTYTAIVNDQIFNLGGFNNSVNAQTPTATFTFDGIKFTGESLINVGTTALNNIITGFTMKNCYADVDPVRLNGFNRTAFIISDLARNGQGYIDFVLENNVILAKGSNDASGAQYGTAIFVYQTLTDGSTIKNNTFGTEDGNYNPWVCIKFFNFEKGANIEVSGNTFYTSGEVFDICPQNTALTNETAFTITFSANKFYSGETDGDIIGLEAWNTFRSTRVIITSDNQLFRKGVESPINYAEMTKDLQYNTFDFLGYNVELDDAGKILSGNFIFGHGTRFNTTNDSDVAAALKGYLAETADPANIHIVVADGLGRRLSDMLEEKDAEGNVTKPANFTTYYIFDATGLENFISLVNGGTYDFSGKAVKFADEFSADHTLDLSGYNTSDDNAWTPIGTADHPFKGTFDGSYVSGETTANWTITGLKYTNYAGTDALLGFFGYTDGGAITNLDIVDFSFNIGSESDSRNIGLLVAHAKGTTISGINVSASSINGNVSISATTGAVVGLLEGGKVENVTVNDTTIDADGTPTIGAVVGKATNSATVSKVYVGGSMQKDGEKDVFVADTNTSVTVTGSASVGGVIGIAESGVSVDTVYSAAKITAKGIKGDNQYLIGGIIGEAKAEGTYTVTNAHFVGTLTRSGMGDTPTTKYANYGLVGAATAEELTGLTITSSDLLVEHHTGFVQTTKWDKDGIVTSEYQVTGVEGLTFFRDQVNGGNSYKNETIHVTQDITLTADFAPIGSTEHPFEGTFKGDKSTTEDKIEGYTISNLKVMHHAAHDDSDGCAPTSNYAGLFGVVNGATIENINFSNVIVTGREYVGVLAGEAKGETTIENVTVTTATVNGHHWVGGLVGYASGTLTVTNNKVTGLTANAVPEKTVDSSSNARFDNGDKLGGLVGYVGCTTATFNNNTVESATLTAYRDIGGLVGIDNGAHGTYTENTVKDVTINVKKTGYTVENDFCTYKADYSYLESDKGNMQNAEWLVGRGNENANNNVEPNADNTRINVTINYYQPEGANDFIYDNGQWRILSVKGLREFANLSKGEAGNHAGQTYAKGFAGATVVIDIDLDLTELNVAATEDPAETPAPVLPIEGFEGTFDGHGHTISDMTVTAADNAGFFGDLKGDVKNVTFTNATVEATGVSSNAGVVAGKLSAAKEISNITVSGATVTTKDDKSVSAGLIGQIAAVATIEDITVDNATLTAADSAVTAGVTTAGTAAALASFGSGSHGTTVTNFNFYGTLTGGNRILMTGATEDNGITFTNSTVALKTEGIEQNSGFFYGAYVGEGEEATVYGDAAKPAYFIENESGLTAFGSFLAEHTLADETVYLLKNLTVASWTNSLGSFEGTFDGLNNTITVSNESNAEGYLFNTLGLLGATAEDAGTTATIKDLTLKGISLAENFTNVSLNNVHVEIGFSGAEKAYYGLAKAAAEKANVTIESSDITVDCTDYSAKFSWTASKATAAANYMVKTAAGLSYLASVVNSGIDFEGRTVTLNAEVDLTNIAWTPIGSSDKTPFKGIFDGNGKKIKNLKITVESDYIGLFGYVLGGTIKDLTIEGVSAIVTADYVGALAGYLNGATLSNIQIIGTGLDSDPTTMKTVFTTGDFVGGVAGYAKNVTVENGLTLSNLKVQGKNHVGGIFGQLTYNKAGETNLLTATLTDMFVDGATANGGAVIGYVDGAVTLHITFSGALSLPEETLSNEYHGLVGSTSEHAAVVIDNGTKLTVVESEGYIVTTVWNADGSVTQSVELTSVDGIKYFRSQILAGNDYNGVVVTLAEGEYDLGALQPLGAEKTFKGTLQGEENKVAAISYTLTAPADAAEYTIGFFSKLEGKVNNITFSNITINATAANGVGVVAARSINAEITNVTVNATKVSGGKWVGGIVGHALSTQIMKCSVTGTFEVQDCYVAGIAGFMDGANCKVEENQIGTEDAPAMFTALATDGKLDADGDRINGYGQIGGIVAHSSGTAIEINNNEIYATIDNSKANIYVLEHSKQGQNQLYVGAIMANGTPSATGNSGNVTIIVAEEVLDSNAPYFGGLVGPGYNSGVGENDITVLWHGLEIENGIYKIKDAAQLNVIRVLVNNGYTFEGETIKLTDNIDLNSSYTTPIGGTRWTTKDGVQVCENPFKGVFDGDSHTISNLIVTANSDMIYGGLFGYIDGTGLAADVASVKNLTLNNVTVLGFAVVGSVAGAIENGLIKNVTVQGNIELVSTYVAEGIGSAAGGISGLLYASSLEECTVKHNAARNAAARATARLAANSEAQKTDISLENSTHIIAAFQYAGGIAAKLDLSKVEDAETVSMIFDELHVSGMVIQILATETEIDDRAAGGLVGSGNVTVPQDTTLEVEVHDNDVRKTEIVYPEPAEGEESDVKVGGLFGKELDTTSDNVTMDDQGNAMQDVYKYEEGKQDEKVELKEGIILEPVAEGKSLLGAYLYKDGEKVGKAQWYEVPDEQALIDLPKEFANNTSADVYLTKSAENGSAVYDMTGKTYTPIADFAGNFYGNGARIEGMTSALFANLAIGASVNDFTLEVNIASGQAALTGNTSGIRAAENNPTYIRNVTIEGTTKTMGVFANKVWSYYGDNSTIKKPELYFINCVNKATQIGSSNRATGFIAQSTGISIQFEDCVNEGDVSTVTSGESHGGAFVAYAFRNDKYANNNFRLTFIRCENKGSVSTRTTSDGRANVGGFIGTTQNGSEFVFEDCVNSGSVTGDDAAVKNQACVGGLVGRHNSGKIIVKGDKGFVSTATITAKATKNDATSTANAYAGGLVGLGSVESADKCNVQGTITASVVAGTGECMAGAVSGKGTGGNISNSEFDVTLSVQKTGLTTGKPANGSLFGNDSAPTGTITDTVVTVKLAEGFTLEGAWDESGVYTGSYTITSAAGLVAFRDSVNNGNTYEGETIYLEIPGKSLDFSADNWTPIGGTEYDSRVTDEEKGTKTYWCTNPFGGSFIGNGTTISYNIKLEGTTNQGALQYDGFFGVLCGSNDQDNPQKITGLNLNVNIVDKANDSRMGGLAGKAYGYILIENVTVSGSIFSNKIASGIIGDVRHDADDFARGTAAPYGCVTMKNVTNLVNITAPKATGFAANVNSVSLTLENCVNGNEEQTAGNLSIPEDASNDVVMGGFTGYIQGSGEVITFTDCTNYGNITIETSAKLPKLSIGSISGGGRSTHNYTNVYNYGNITVDDQYTSTQVAAEIGGLIGSASGPKNFTNVYNYGNISYTSKGTGDYRVGGFFGEQGGKVVMENCVLDCEITIIAATAPNGVKADGKVDTAHGVGVISGNSAHNETAISNTDLFVTCSVGAFNLNDTTDGEGNITGSYSHGLTGGNPAKYYNHTGTKYDNIKNVTLVIVEGDENETTTTLVWDAEGNVTKNSVLVIHTLDGLKAFRDDVNKGNNYAGATVVLASDIDLKNENWTPIGSSSRPFCGTFDGMGHTIKNLMIDDSAKTSGSGGLALFDVIGKGAKVMNFTLHNVNIIPGLQDYGPVWGDMYGSWVGAVVGEMAFQSGSLVDNVHVTGDLYIAGGQYVGGIVGRNNYGGNITNCSVEVNEGSVLSCNCMYVGGIVGWMPEGNYQVLNCTVSNLTIKNESRKPIHDLTVSLQARMGGIGGIAQYGNTFSGNKLENVTIITEELDADFGQIGAIVGTWNISGSSVATITNNTGDVTIITPNGVMYSNGVVGSCFDNVTPNSTLDLSTNEVTVTWNGLTYNADGTVTIKDRAGLIEFAKVVNGGNAFEGITISLEDNIDLGGMYWSPIGNAENPFKGIFNGNGHVISNLNVLAESYAGLFGYASKAKISDLTLASPTVTGTSNVGALLGYAADSSQVYNITVTDPTITGVSAVGGIAGGYFPAAPVDGSTVSGLIRISGHYKVGGVVGAGYGTVTDTTVNGTVGSFIKATYLEEDIEGDSVGGIIGYTGEGHYDFHDLTVKGVTISGTRKVGGIMGMLHANVQLSNVTVEDVTISNLDTPDFYAEKYKDDTKGFYAGSIVGEFGNGSSITHGTVKNVNVNMLYTYDTGKQGGFMPGAVVGGSRGGASAKVTITDVTIENVRVNGLILLNIDNSYGTHYGAYNAEDLLAFNAAVREGRVASVEHPAVAVLDILEDIDMSGKEWVTMSGNHLEVDGNSHTISNLTVTAESKYGKAAFIGGTGNRVHNLTIDGFKAEGEQVAVFVANPDTTVYLQNVTVKGTVSLKYKDIDTGEYKETYNSVGVLVGMSFGTDYNSNDVSYYGTYYSNVVIDPAAKITVDVTGMTTANYGPTTDYIFGYYFKQENVATAHLADVLTAKKVTYDRSSLTIKADGVEYHEGSLKLSKGADIAKAFALLGENDKVTLAASDTAYELPTVLSTNGLVIEGADGAKVLADAADGNRLYVTGNNVTLKNLAFASTKTNGSQTYFLTISGDNATVEGCSFDITSTNYTALSISGGAENVTIKDCEFIGGFRQIGNCEGTKDTTITIEGCSFHGGTYGVHFDVMNGATVVIKDCEIAAWSSFGATGGGKVVISDTTFKDDGPGSQNYFRPYVDAELTNCTFEESFKYSAGETGITITVTNPHFTGEGKDMINSSAEDHPFTLVVDGVETQMFAPVEG